MEGSEQTRSQRYRDRETRKLDEAVTDVSDAIDQSINRLKGYHSRMMEMRENGSSDLFRTEQMKSCNEINNLKALLNQLNVINNRVPNECNEHFERRMQKIQQKVEREVSLFQTDLRSQMPLPPNQPSVTQQSKIQKSTSRGGQQLIQGNLELESDIASVKYLLKSWRDLQRDLTDLNEMMMKLSTMVKEQREMVDHIDNNISTARSHVEEGAITLSKIKKGFALPLIGAGIGAAIAGPLGGIVGYKAAAVACLGTASIGYFSGKVVQKMTNPPDFVPLSIEGHSQDRSDDENKDRKSA